MEFAVHWIDVKPYLLAQQQPVLLLKRPKAHAQPKAWAGPSQVGCLGDYWVPQSAVLGPEPVGWGVTRTGELVRVPVFAYKMPRSLAALGAFNLQIGLAALADLRKHTSDVPLAVTLVYGHEVSDLYPGEDAFRCYVGLAVRTK